MCSGREKGNWVIMRRVKNKDDVREWVVRLPKKWDCDWGSVPKFGIFFGFPNLKRFDLG